MRIHRIQMKLLTFQVDPRFSRYKVNMVWPRLDNRNLFFTRISAILRSDEPSSFSIGTVLRSIGSTSTSASTILCSIETTARPNLIMFHSTGTLLAPRSIFPCNSGSALDNVRPRVTCLAILNWHWSLYRCCFLWSWGRQSWNDALWYCIAVRCCSGAVTD